MLQKHFLNKMFMQVHAPGCVFCTVGNDLVYSKQRLEVNPAKSIFKPQLNTTERLCFISLAMYHRPYQCPCLCFYLPLPVVITCKLCIKKSTKLKTIAFDYLSPGNKGQLECSCSISCTQKIPGKDKVFLQY